MNSSAAAATTAEDVASAARQRFVFLRKTTRGAGIFAAYGAAILALLAFVSFFSLPANVQSSRALGPLFSDEQLLSLRDDEAPPAAAVATGLRVVLVLVDGMRWDAAHDWEGPMRTLFRNSSFSPDVALVESRAELPSMSYPNWVAAFTGAPPEATGVLGNNAVESALLRSESARLGLVDSLLFKCRDYGMRSGVSAASELGGVAEWWRLALAPFDGQAFVTVINGHYSTVDPLIADAALEAMADTSPKPFDFIYVSFGDVDHQGHYDGARSDGTYGEALANKSVLVQSIFAAADNNTAVVVYGDHGHTDSGSHGGAFEESVLRTPVAFYLKGSGLGSNFSRVWHKGTVLDMPTSIAALLGVPPPRLSQGVFFEAAETLLPGSQLRQTYQMLFIQKQRYVGHFVNNTKTEAALTSEDAAALGMPDTPSTLSTMSDEEAISWYHNSVEALLAAHSHARASHLKRFIGRNAGVAVVVALVLVGVAIALLLTQTLCNPFACVSRTMHARANGLGLFLAFATWAGYLLVTIGASLLVERFAFTPRQGWDWSLANLRSSEEGMLHYLPGIAIGAVTAIALHVLVFFSTRKKNPELCYCIEQYALLVGTVVATALLLSTTGRFVVLPGLLENPYIEASAWESEFQAMSVGIWTVPMLATCVLILIFWQPDEDMLWGMRRRKGAYEDVPLLSLRAPSHSTTAQAATAAGIATSAAEIII